MKTVLVPLMPGFEEIEAITLIDVLRRGGIQVIIASDDAGSVLGAHDIEVLAERGLESIQGDELDMIALPGGLPGAEHLAKSEHVLRLLKQVEAGGGYTAAICAAPMALAAAGVHQGHEVTSYPGFAKHLEGGTYREDRVVVDRRVVTSRGPGTAMEFALQLVELLEGKDKRAQMEQGLLFNT